MPSTPLKKNTQEVIEELEHKYQLLFETMELGVIYQNNKGKITDSNPAATRILGLTLDQMNGKTSLDSSWKSIHEDGSDYLGETHPSMLALETGKPVLNRVMGIVNSIDNEYRWISINAIPQFKGSEKKPYQVYTTFNDITATKNTELLLKQGEQRYAKAQQMGKVGNWEYNYQTKQLWGSEEALRIFGLDSNVHDLTLENMYRCIVEPKNVGEAIANLIEKREEFDIEYAIIPGNENTSKIIQSKAELIFDENNKISRIVGVIQDITKRKNTENLLKESEDKFFSTFKNSSNSIVLIRLRDHKIINCNDATLKTIGYTLKELKAMKSPQKKLWKSLNDFNDYTTLLKKDGIVKDFEANFIKKNGEIRTWLASGEIINLENEKFILNIIEDITVIRKTQEDLKLQSDFTIAMTENQPAGIVACNAKGKLVLFNKAAKDWHGIDVLKIPQKEWAENYGLYKGDSETVIKTEDIPLIKAFNEGKVVNLEMVIKAKGQEPRFVICNGASFFDTLGNKIGAMVVMNDVTHQKIIERELKSSEAKIKTALREIERSEFLLNESGEIAKIGAWEYDLITEELRWSNQVFKIHGIPVGKIPSFEEAIRFYIDGSDKIIVKAIEESIAKNKKYDLELRFQNANKEKLWVNAIGYPVSNKKGDVIGIRGVIQDITEQKLTRIKIEKSQEMHRLLANNTNDLICLQEPDSTFKYISPSIKTLLGYEQAEFLGKQVFGIVHKDDVLPLKSAIKKEVFRNSTADAFPFRAKHKKGHYIWLEFLSSPVYKDGEINYFVTSARDITQWVLAKEEIQEYQTSLQKLTTEITMIEEKQKKEIASNIHDNLSQSLVISKMRIKDMRKNPGFDMIAEDLKFIESHISDALENSRKITYELSPPVLYQLGIIDALNWLLESLETTHKIKFTLISDVIEIKLTDLESIILYRSIQEVLTNAIKHAKASLITVTFEKDELGVDILIVDNGGGFDTSVLNNYRNHSGSGFGLFTVQERIKNIQGKFTLESEINTGTTINIFIPLSK